MHENCGLHMNEWSQPLLAKFTYLIIILSVNSWKADVKIEVGITLLHTKL